MAKPWYDNDQVINQLDSGYHWSGSTITYGFPTEVEQWVYTYNTGENINFSQFTAEQQEMATLAIELWDDLITPDFVYTADGNNAQVQYANTTSGGYAHAYYPSGGDWGGTIWMNSNKDSGGNSLYPPTPGTYGFQTFLHETGHALGLTHPGDYNGSGTNYRDDAEYTQDSYQYTV